MSGDLDVKQAKKRRRCAIILPSYREAAALEKLLPAIHRELPAEQWDATILVVNDLGCEDPALQSVCQTENASCLTVPYNMGHQEAILFGLRAALSEKGTGNGAADAYFVTMDADGQDDPRDIRRLIDAAAGGGIAVAKRAGTRPESGSFRILHGVFKVVFRALCGFTPDFGNFAAFSGPLARQIAQSPHCDTCYAMSLPLVAPVTRVPSVRRARIGGNSRLGFAGLFDHGLRLLLPHLRAISRRLAIASVAAGSVTIAVALVAIVLKLFAPAKAFPNWASTITIGAVIVCLQLFTICVLLFLITSLSRQVSVLARMGHLLRNKYVGAMDE